MPIPIPWEDVGATPGSVVQADAEWVASQRAWQRGWRRLVLATLFLAYLVYVGQSVAENSHGYAAVAGYAILGAFVVCYLVLMMQVGAPDPSPFWASWGVWALYAGMVALFVAELPFARTAAFAMCLYLTVIAVAGLGAKAAPIVVVLTLGALFVPPAVPSWHVTLSGAFDAITPVALPVAAVVTFAVIQVQRGNQALAEAHAKIAQLSAENERSRIARDLHDLLGHSLTTITVKAGLARKLSAADPGRAAQEIAAVEELSRHALAEVRAAVSSYRHVTLAGELARGRELLRASGVTADFPTATDVVDGAHQELFGWAVREGITNVARHARATRCTVVLSASEVEIRDDGVGGPISSGNGLAGLRERVEAAGGTLEAGPLGPRGWQLRVALGPVGGMAGDRSGQPVQLGEPAPSGQPVRSGQPVPAKGPEPDVRPAVTFQI
ncbi:MAG TPA: sensor histidine kinase [Acidimicrobiales bacterium]|nr:sensor histidine kinase [Acidimicrobiales bacterium]